MSLYSQVLAAFGSASAAHTEDTPSTTNDANHP